MKLIKKIDDNFEATLLVIDFSVMIVVIALQVFCRKALNSSLVWSEELGRFLFTWQIFLGASLAIKDDSHMKVDIIYMIFPAVKKWIKVFSYALFFAFSAFMCVEGGGLAMSILHKGQLSPAIHIPMGLVYMILPLSTFLMCLRLAQKIIITLRGKREEE